MERPGMRSQLKARSHLKAVALLLSVVALQACIPLFSGGLFQTLKLSFELDRAIAAGEKSVFQILVFPENVKVAKKWLQISGRLTPATNETLPGQVRVEAQLEDVDTGKKGQKIALNLQVDGDGFFSASKKIKKNIVADQMMTVTIQPAGTGLTKGSQITLCVDLVQKKADLKDLQACVSGGSSTGPAPTLSSIQEDIFTPTCALSGCHSSGSDSGGLTLEEGQSHGELVNRASTGVPSFDRVVPGNAELSYLMKKLLGDADIVGSRMPRGGGGLDEEQLDQVERWIEAGAADN